MKFICDGLDLSDAVLKVSKGLSSRTTNQILEGIKIHAAGDTITLTATDLELTIEKKIKADVKVEGDAVILGRVFTEFVKRLSNKAQIEFCLTDTRQLRIKYLDSNGLLNCLDAEQYPSVEKLRGQNCISIVQSELKDLISKSLFSAAGDDNRPVLRGVFFDVDGFMLTAAALDGYRMSVIKKGLEKDCGAFCAIVPTRALSELTKLIDNDDEIIVNIVFDRRSLMVDLGHTVLISRLIEGEYVKYKTLIGTDFSSTVTVEKKSFAECLDRAGVLLETQKNNHVRFDIRDKMLTMTSNSQAGNIEEKLPISLNGKDVKIAFNLRYLTDVLHAINDSLVNLYFNNSIAPCIIRPSDEKEDALFLVLPVRIMDN